MSKNPQKQVLAMGQVGAQCVHTHCFSPSALTFCVCEKVFVCVLFSVPLGARLRLWFGWDPGSRVRRGRACRCEAVGGWPGQHEDFGWVGRLDVVHHSSNPPSHPHHPKSFGCVPRALSLEGKYCLSTVLQDAGMPTGS